MPQFSRDRWPVDGPVRELLAYLDELHREAGQPSLADMGRAVALAPSTLSGFFTGARLVGRGNLELLVEHLGGDIDRAEQLRRRAATAWNSQRAQEREKHDRVHVVAVAEGGARLELVLYDAPVNRLNRPEQLLGRQDLITAIEPLLDRGERVLVHGLGGSGKTALAATIADQRVRAGKGTYLWLRCGPAGVDAVLDALTRALANQAERELVHAATGDARLLAIGRVISRLGVRLCVFDDAWDPAALHTLLRAIPDDVGVLVASRLKLSLAHQFEVSELAAVHAARLLALHAKNEAYATDTGAQRLCRELGHHPYAIEIAGNHLRQYTTKPSALCDLIAGAPHELPMPGGFAQAGRESVKRLLDQAFQTLANPDAREVLGAFGAFFTGTVTPELLSIHLGRDGNRIVRALNELVDVSLAKRRTGSLSYEVHDLTFSYARALHRDGAEPGLPVVDAVARLVAGHPRDHGVLAAELGNILAAADIARNLDATAFVAIIEALATGGYIDDKGHTLGLLRLLDEVIDIVRAEPGQAERLHHLLSKRGNAAQNQGDYAGAVTVYREALELAPNPRRQVVLLSVLGRVLAEQSRHGEADDQFAQAYAIAAATGDEYSMLKILEQHSIAAFRQKDYERVRDLATQGVDLACKLDERLLEAVFLNNLGTAYFELGVCAAIERHERARAIAEEVGNDSILALTHRTLGADHHAQERFEPARTHFAEALRLYASLGQTERETKLRQLMRQFGYLQ